mmetsp:Transcript_45749/g.90205  ORF Transcript_45749/g.90205 Transcript_45749/m.90205 type:complete len:89 (+) Transcript_45749:1329-1595(+)
MPSGFSSRTVRCDDGDDDGMEFPWTTFGDMVLINIGDEARPTPVGERKAVDEGNTVRITTTAENMFNAVIMASQRKLAKVSDSLVKSQ